MQISKEQMDVFSQKELDKYEIRIADFLQAEFPDAKKIPQEELLPVIHHQINNSRSYGFETEQQIANYVTTAWLLGQQFDTEFPAAKEILNSSKYDLNYKSKWLFRWTEEIFSTLEEGN